MAITCPKCGAAYDATLFQFGHGVRCDCGEWVELTRGHVIEQVPLDKQPQHNQNSIRLAPGTEPDKKD